MAGEVFAKKAAKAALKAPGDPGVQSLVQDLLRQVASDTEQGSAFGVERDAAGVILDVEVEGVRCLLVRRRADEGRPPVKLSPREQEIARMVGEGYPNKTIAAVLEISSWTVCTHLRRIFSKLGVRSRASMVARLLEERATAGPSSAER